MRSRWTFLHHRRGPYDRWGRRRRVAGRGSGRPRESRVGRGGGKSARIEPETRDEAVLSEVGEPTLPRKTPREGPGRPYPKPTQVVG